MAMDTNRKTDSGRVHWGIEFDSWSALRVFTYVKLFGVYGFVVFVLSNIPLLAVAPSSGRLISEPWRYVGLSAVSSLGIVAIALAVYKYSGSQSSGRVITVIGTEISISESIGIVPLSFTVLLGAWAAAVLVVFLPSGLFGMAVILVPVVIKMTDTIASLVVPLSGSVDTTNKIYQADSSERSYDLSIANVVASVGIGGVTVFCVRAKGGPPHILVLPTELYESIYEI
ncbi:hypothetical protein [Haladaptatus paucihalophilus]|uniref:Uncharacterized protein n=1 Tax=Haladaptatus paucihalophilus DX253 TaxID=797209 RepID=A0A1M7CM65_HALPU|nr:hypothetical protein [Haladaptatus paucihalophilus]SHL68300.1 hypothetical protein SAMN05444342_4401 [Haladaptatus paucihalophilus DX253]